MIRGRYYEDNCRGIMGIRMGNILDRLRIVKILKQFTCELNEQSQGSKDKFQEVRADLSGIIMTELTEFPSLMCRKWSKDS